MRYQTPLCLVILSATLASGCTPYHRVPRSTETVVTQSYVHKYGVPLERNEWASRGKNGQVVSMLKSGVTVTENYLDGYLDGETSYSFPHSGAIQKVEVYAQGHLTKERENYRSGAPKLEVSYTSSGSKDVTSWYEEGTPHYREIYENGRLMEGDYYTIGNQIDSHIDNGDGKRMNRDEFGQLASIDKFQEGQLAYRTILYPNGTPKEIIPYVGGRINGQKKTFLPDGEPSTIEGWVNDKQEGITYVYQNGEKVAEVQYLNGLKSGIEERYRDGKYLVEEVTWHKGKRHGPSYTHIADDVLISWYYEGQEVSKTQYDKLFGPR